MSKKYTDKDILGAFLLVNDYRVLSNEEIADVKVSLTNLLKENEDLKKQCENTINYVKNCLEHLCTVDEIEILEKLGYNIDTEE